MLDHPALQVETRRSVYERVSANPGAHLRDVARRAALPLGTALYHLDALETAGLVAARRDGRYKRYFCTAHVGRQDKDLLSILRHQTPRRVVLALLATPGLTQRELCSRLKVSRSTLSFHAAQLVSSGLVSREPSRPESRYAVRDPHGARAVLLRYRSSLSTGDEADLFAALEAPAPAALAAEEGLA